MPRYIDADKIIYSWMVDSDGEEHDGVTLQSIIRKMPTTDVIERQWIPVSERLPKNDDWVIVTILDESGDTPWRYTDFGWYLEAANCWVVAAEQRTDIIAWMPLPEPYKKEKDDGRGKN